MQNAKMLDCTYFKISKDWEAEDFSVIPVTIHIPQNVPSRIKQWKINIIYDILKPKTADVKELRRAC